MRRLRTTITFLVIIAAMLVLVGVLSGNARHNRAAGSSEEPVCGQGIDAARSVLMYI